MSEENAAAKSEEIRCSDRGRPAQSQLYFRSRADTGPSRSLLIAQFRIRIHHRPGSFENSSPGTEATNNRPRCGRKPRVTGFPVARMRERSDGTTEADRKSPRLLAATGTECNGARGWGCDGAEREEGKIEEHVKMDAPHIISAMPLESSPAWRSSLNRVEETSLVSLCRVGPDFVSCPIVAGARPLAIRSLTPLPLETGGRWIIRK